MESSPLVIQCEFCEDGINADILEMHHNVYVVQCKHCGETYEIFKQHYIPQPSISSYSLG